MKKVTKNTRAGKNGRIIGCPKCGHPTRVYHMQWEAITCQNCLEMVDKKKFIDHGKAVANL